MTCSNCKYFRRSAGDDAPAGAGSCCLEPTFFKTDKSKGVFVESYHYTMPDRPACARAVRRGILGLLFGRTSR